jgi:YHS domain-containing protein
MRDSIYHSFNEPEWRFFMRLMTAAALVLFCIASGCDNSSTSTDSSKKEVPPDVQESVTPSATAPANTPTSAPATQASAGTPINKFCAVEKDNKIDPKVTTVYEGKTIAFCCKDCIPDFKKDPAKYMASLK